MQAQLNMNYVNTTSELASIELQKKNTDWKRKEKARSISIHIIYQTQRLIRNSIQQ